MFSEEGHGAVHAKGGDKNYTNVLSEIKTSFREKESQAPLMTHTESLFKMFV